MNKFFCHEAASYCLLLGTLHISRLPRVLEILVYALGRKLFAIWIASGGQVSTIPLRSEMTLDFGWEKPQDAKHDKVS